jgi:diaminopimelate decarboxylase
MNDFMRTALYDVCHDIVPIIKTGKKNLEPVEFVGPICETTCKFVQYKKYQKIREGDFVAITNVGAYGSSLSSNYNTKPLIAEILTTKNNSKIIRKKQDLLKLINS